MGWVEKALMHVPRVEGERERERERDLLLELYMGICDNKRHDMMRRESNGGGREKGGEGREGGQREMDQRR